MGIAKRESYKARVARREKRLPIRGVEYCINEWGDPGSPLLVYLHGWADTGSTFQFVVDAMVNKWFVVAPDWRGFGRTQHRCESYWFPDYLADLHAILQHYSPNQPLKLVGHSMGANIGSLYAGIFPERVRALVNIEGFGLPETDPDDAPQRYREWIEAGSAESVFADYSSFTALARRIQLRSKRMDDSKAEFVAREWARESSDGRIRLRADATHKMPNAVLYRRAEAEACWHNVSAAVLLVSGDQSDFQARFDVSGTIRFPTFQAVTLPGAGHMIHFEIECELARCIEEFLLETL